MKKLLAALVLNVFSVALATSGARTDREQDGLKGPVRSVTTLRSVQTPDSDRWIETGDRLVAIYDRQGTKTEIAVYNPDGYPATKTLYTDDAQGRGKRAETTTYDSDGFPQHKWATIHDAQGHVVEEEYYNPDGSLQPPRASDRRFGAMGMVVGGSYSKTYTYYDAQGNRIEEMYNYDNDVLSSKFVNTYDAEGQETDRAAYHPDGSLINRHVTTRELDALGNWLKQTESLCMPQTDSGQLACHPQMVTVRTLAYYQGGPMATQSSEEAFSSAVQDGDSLAVQAFLASGMNPDVNSGHALRMAMVHDRLDIFRMLLGKGADMNARGADGETVWTLATKRGYTTFVNIMLDKGASVQAGLMYAVQKGDMDLVQTLLAKGANVNTKAPGDVTALMLAADNGRMDLVQTLLAKGANVNAKAQGNSTALMRARAARNGHTDVVKVLLVKGADVNVKSQDGFTPLMLAAGSGHTEIVKALLDEGADVNAKGLEGRSALHWAMPWGPPDLVRALLDKGADVDARDQANSTPLMRAVGYGASALVKLLLDRGADVNARDQANSTALMQAKMMWPSVRDRQAEIMQLLTQAGATE